MAVTIKEVAERAGVSRSAVSRTFTDGASVSERMRSRVEEAAEELGYSPSILASSLTTRRTKLVGLVSDNFGNPAFLTVFDLLTRGLQEKGLRPLLVNLSDERNPDSTVRMLRQYGVDGVIVASSTLSPGFSRAFQDAHLPVVNSFGRYARRPAFHVVGVDNVECGRMAARELVARRYRRVGFLGGPKSATSTQDRLSGFMDALVDYPKIVVSHSFADAYSYDAGRLAMSDLLRKKPQQAYFCGDDVLSIGAMCAIQEHGLSVPEDIGLIGLNDVPMAGWTNVNLTTIHQPFEKIIHASVELIAAMLKNTMLEAESRVFPCSVIERKSLRALPGSG